MKAILANDGIDPEGKDILEKNGYCVYEQKMPPEEISTFINEKQVDVLIVRSATQVRRELIEACSNLKIIARAGVGTDNIDLEAAKAKNIKVLNTPGASSQSVAELVFAHMFTLARRLQLSNRFMPEKGHSDFNALKKRFSDGIELRGRTLGILGFGRIGQTVASLALGMGMRIIPYDPIVKKATVELDIIHIPENTIKIEFESQSLDELLGQSDFITLHVPKQPGGRAILGAAEFQKMKKGAYIINTSRGGLVDELALLEFLNSGYIGGAGLDVFENEPSPLPDLLKHPLVSVTPHIGGSTRDAQVRIGIELAQRIIEVYPH